MPLTLPSGYVCSQLDMDLFRLMHQCGFVRHCDKPFTLKSGIKSHVYVFGREDLTDNPELESFVGRKISLLFFHEAEPQDKQICLLGIPTAGTPFAQAAAMISFGYKSLFNKYPICHRIMKEVPKDHGAHKGWINGKPSPNHSYWLVDNVATNGDSKIEAREKMRADGYPEPAGVVIWIDRQQGAIPRLQKDGFKRILIAYNLLDVTYAYGELGLWPKSAVKAVEQEIEAHQFLPQT